MTSTFFAINTDQYDWIQNVNEKIAPAYSRKFFKVRNNRTLKLKFS